MGETIIENYTLLSFNYIYLNKLFIGFFTLLEYFLFFIEYNYIITDFKYSFEKNKLDNYFFNKISPLKAFRNFIDNDGKYSFIFLISIIFLQFSFYGFLFIKLQKYHIIQTFLVNFYEVFYFRTFTIFYLDIIVNYIIYCGIHLNQFLYIFLFFICIIYLFLTIYTIYYDFLFFIFFKIKESQEYPFDLLTNHFNIYFLFIKLILVLISQLKRVSVPSQILKHLTVIIIFLFILIFSWYCRKLYKYPFLGITNFTLHKFRLSLLTICVLWTINSLTGNYIYQNNYYFIGICFFIFIIIFFLFLSLDVYLKIIIKNLKPINQLIYIIYLKNNLSDEKIKTYIEKLEFHLSICGKCNFCIAYLNIKRKKIYFKKTTTVIKKKDKFHISQYDNILYFYFKSFYSMFKNEIQNSKLKDFDKIPEIFYDLFSIYQYCFISRTLTYKLKNKMSNLLYKYKNSDQNILLNIKCIYLELFDTKDETTLNIVGNIKLYLLFVNNLNFIIDRINRYFKNEVKSPLNFIKLGMDIQNLKNKKYIEFLRTKQKSNDYCIDLITYILEEVTNISINQEKGFMKDSILLNEEILNLYYNKANNIIISCNMKKNSLIIEKTGKDMIQYVGKEFYSLFPREFRNEGIKKLKQSMKSKDKLKTFDFLINSELQNQEDIELDESPIKNGINYSKNVNRKYKRFVMKYKLYFDDLEKDEFYINGEYFSKSDELIITKIFNNKKNIFQTKRLSMNKIEGEYIFSISLKKKKEEILMKNQRLSIMSLSSYHKNLKRGSTTALIKINEIFKKTCEGDIIINNSTFKLLYHINGVGCKYNIYSSSKNFKNTYIEETIVSGIFEEEKNNIYMKLGENASIASFNSQSSISSHPQKEKMLMVVKLENRYKQYQSRFVSITKISFFFCIAMIIYCIICIISELYKNQKLLNSYSVYTQLRALNRLFYNTITSILAINCIGKPGEENCINYYQLYSDNFNKKYNINFPSFNYSVYENPYKVYDYGTGLIKLKQKIYQLGDPVVNNIFNNEFIYTYISIKNSQIKTNNSTTTFVGALEILFNGLIVILESGKYTNHSVYIFSMANFDFSNVYNQEHLEDWQMEYYNLVMNYEKYLETWVTIQISVGDNTNNRLKSLSNTVIIFLNISNFCHIFLFCLLYFFIYSFENLFKMSINKLMKKFEDKKFVEFFIYKYHNLKILLKFFEQNPISILHDIQGLYSEFFRQNQTNKKEKIKDENEFKKEIEIVEEKNYFPLSAYRVITGKYLILILFIFAYYLLLFLIFLVIWYKDVKDTLNVFNIITDNTVAACSGYNMFALCQIMLLANQTQSEISINMKYDKDNYLFYESTRSLFCILDLERRRQNVKHLIKTTNDFIDLNCNTFYSDINDKRFEEVDLNNPEINFRKKYPDFCKFFHILEYKNDQIFYKPIFYEINKYIASLNKRSYDDYIDYLINGNLFYMCDLQFLIYRPFRSWFNDVVYNDAINNSINLEKTILFSNLFITIISEFIIFGILYIQVFGKLKNTNSILIAVKNIFKIVK